ncbi:MAG: hypothetical protein JSS86_12255 [Cyanobacteria bacterium SZAS LIN-2]|nr:hypothetical protein [Cyanobacteria bacterium SZAS LIN-2]MBS2005409.1 hypothetical protein [Cyanobacteria bacterium SZAS TMP-1]
MGQTPFDQDRSTTQELNNLLDVSWRTASSTPSAFINELADDFSKRTSQVVAHFAEGVAVGAVGTAVLKIPKVAPAVAALGLLYTGYKAYEGGSEFVASATKADTEAQREQLSRTTAHNLGSGLAAFVESAPGMALGGYGISRAFGAPALYSRIGNAVENSVLAPTREAYAFRGPGSIKIPSSLVSGEGEFDALAVSKVLAQRHPWTGVETGSSLDLSKLRISRVVSGEADIIGKLPGASKDNVIPFHIHGPKAPSGALPSNMDLAATRDLGILQHGQTTTFFVGEGRSYAALAKVGQESHFAPSLRAVSINQETGLAQRITGEWHPSRGWQMNMPETLDFSQSLQAISQMRARSPWLSLSSIAAKTGG